MTDNTNDTPQDLESAVRTLTELFDKSGLGAEIKKHQDDDPARTERLRRYMDDLTSDGRHGVILIDFARTDSGGVRQRCNVTQPDGTNFTREDVVGVLVACAADLLMEEVPAPLRGLALPAVIEELPKITMQWLQGQQADQARDANE